MPVPPGNGQMIENESVHYVWYFLYNWLLSIISAIECAAPVPPGNGQMIENESVHYVGSTVQENNLSSFYNDLKSQKVRSKN